MKKIVALVLAMVMVLGLATTAFAASAPTITWTEIKNAEFDVMEVGDTDGEIDPAYADATLRVSDAKAPQDTTKPKDGIVDVYGWVKGFEVTYVGGLVEYMVQVPTLAAADFVIYYADTETLFGYFVSVGLSEAGLCYLAKNPAAFANFGEDCTQLDYEPVEDTDYYFFEGVVYEETTFTAMTGDAEVFMVGNELVPAEPIASAADFNAHAAVFSYNKDYEVIAVECEDCGATATIYANRASVPVADKKVNNLFPINDGEYYCWNAAKAPVVDTETVESAKTFDAGIAMYVGMSVMAAAGSAVVLKKRED